MLFSLIHLFFFCKAREDPELTYDISDCEISDIPAGTFSLIKVLQKEVSIHWRLIKCTTFLDILHERIDHSIVSFIYELTSGNGPAE